MSKLGKHKRNQRREIEQQLKVVDYNKSTFAYIARKLVDQIDKRNFERKYAPVADVLKLVGAGAFLAASVAFPKLPKAIKPLFLSDESEVWKRFNIPYLRRTLKRLEKQKLVEIGFEGDQQTVKITNGGRRRILKYSLAELTIQKPKFWDGKWRLISYDIPKNLNSLRKAFREYLEFWKFYPLHESVFLHAYPCEREVDFLREYLGIGEFVRLFLVDRIENDASYKEFFGI